MLAIIKKHPFWGQTIDITLPNGKVVRKYKYIRKANQNVIFTHWQKHPITWQFGGYFCKEPIFQIICETAELYSISSSQQVYGKRERVFIDRLNEFRTKFEYQFNSHRTCTDGTQICSSPIDSTCTVNIKDFTSFKIEDLMDVTVTSELK